MQLTNFHLILCIIAILLILYILYKLKYKKRALIELNEIPIIEGYTTIDEAVAEVEEVVSKYNEFSNISSIKANYTNMPVHEYCIKSSYNTACSGNYVSSQMIEAVLKRGCRFIDFEIFYVGEGESYTPMVAVSSDNLYRTMDTKNSIPLDEALGTIAGNAFSQTSPNKNDPIFVNLRIKSHDANVYQAVAKSISSTLSTLIYSGEISENTLLSDIMGKVVIVIDKTIRPEYRQHATCDSGIVDCFELTNYMNMESGSEYLNKYNYTDLLNHANTPALLKDDNIRTTTTRMKMAVPDKELNTTNPALTEFVIKHGCQNVFYQFHIVDTNLLDYEEFFNDNMGGIIPLSVALPYLVD